MNVRFVFVVDTDGFSLGHPSLVKGEICPRRYESADRDHVCLENSFGHIRENRVPPAHCEKHPADRTRIARVPMQSAATLLKPIRTRVNGMARYLPWRSSVSTCNTPRKGLLRCRTTASRLYPTRTEGQRHRMWGASKWTTNILRWRSALHHSHESWKAHRASPAMEMNSEPAFAWVGKSLAWHETPFNDADKFLQLYFDVELTSTR